MSKSDNSPIMGRWHRMKVRCHRCNRPVEQVYVVTDPPISGKFCGKQCYQIARDHYESEQNKKV